MRWIIFILFAYAMLGAQVGVGEALRWGGMGPNLVLLAVVFVCLNTTREAALTGALMLGFLQDLLTLNPIGLNAFAYGLVGLLCTTSNRVVYADHPLTHVVFAFVGQIITAAVVLSYSFVRPAGVGLEAGGHLPAMPFVYSAMYTALISPVVLGVLTRVKPLFGFAPVRRKVRAYV
jgi:rod shape-determining protein MreD